MSGIRAVSKFLVASTFALGFALIVVGCDGGSASNSTGAPGGGAATSTSVAGKSKDTSAKNVKGKVDFSEGIPKK